VIASLAAVWTYSETHWEAADVRMRWDRRRRALDTIFVERLWRSVKYEEESLKGYQSVTEAVNNLRAYFICYNHGRVIKN
jgi:putative transposase